jgi:hypothetical protein
MGQDVVRAACHVDSGHAIDRQIAIGVYRWVWCVLLLAVEARLICRVGLSVAELLLIFWSYGVKSSVRSGEEGGS